MCAIGYQGNEMTGCKPITGFFDNSKISIQSNDIQNMSNEIIQSNKVTSPVPYIIILFIIILLIIITAVYFRK